MSTKVRDKLFWVIICILFVFMLFFISLPFVENWINTNSRDNIIKSSLAKDNIKVIDDYDTGISYYGSFFGERQVQTGERMRAYECKLENGDIIILYLDNNYKNSDEYVLYKKDSNNNYNCYKSIKK